MDLHSICISVFALGKSVHIHANMGKYVRILVGRITQLGKTIDLKTEAKYFGVLLDCKLNWITHAKEKAQKALTAFWT